MISMAEQPPAAAKPAVKLRDLAPREDPRAGNSVLHPEAPPLPIPPPGFIVGAETGERGRATK
jgi:hypothetical protein